MRKSLFLTFDFPPKRGGISNSLWNICSHLPNNKLVILTEKSDINLHTIFPVYRKNLLSKTKFIWPKWLPLIWYIRKLIEKDQIQIIHAAQILPFGTIALILKKIYKIPYIVYVYGQDLIIMRGSFRKMILIRRILKNAESVIANSSYTRHKAIKLGANKDKTITVYPAPNGLENTSAEAAALENFKSKYNLEHKKVILTVGNLVKRKGHDQVVRSLPQVLKVVPETVYFIVGKGPRKEHIQNEINKLNLRDTVKILENIDDNMLPILYQLCDLFIMPSRKLKNKLGQTIDAEGFGMVFLEANLFNKPVIGGRTGGIPEAVEDGVSGILIDPENVQEIAAAIIKLLSNQDYAQRLGEQGRERAFNKFQWDNEVAKIKQIL